MILWSLVCGYYAIAYGILIRFAFAGRNSLDSMHALRVYSPSRAEK